MLLLCVLSLLQLCLSLLPELLLLCQLLLEDLLLSLLLLQFTLQTRLFTLNVCLLTHHGSPLLCKLLLLLLCQCRALLLVGLEPGNGGWGCWRRGIY